ncbi:MAG: hypothetical protein KF764_02220 [Labilithrix sp.]|nr:hypothetical protein [Labilithrix sp.]
MSAASTSSAAPGSSAIVDAPTGTAIVHGLGEPGSLAIDATHVYFADKATGTVARVPHDGGEREILATGREAPSQLALSGADVVWLDGGGSLPSTEGGDASKRGVFACSREKTPCTVRNVRAGTFVALVAADGGLFLAEKLDPKRFAVSRVAGDELTRVGDHEGRAIAMTVDRANVYVATFGAANKPKIVTVPRKAGAHQEVTFSGPGFNHLADDDDQLLGTGIISHQFGLFRVAKGASTTTLLAADVAPGVFARHGDDVYFVSGADLTLRKVPRSGGAATVVGRLTGLDEPTALAIADGWAYVSGKAAGDAGGSGAILRLPVR